MGDINDLRRARNAAADDMKAKATALAALEDQGDASEDDVTSAQAAFDAAKADFGKADKQVKRAEDVEAAQLASAVPEPTDSNGDGQRASAPAQIKEPGLKFGAALRVMAAAGGNLQAAQQIAEDQGHSGLFANQNASEGIKGGFLVPADVADEVIELLRPKSVVSAMGAINIPMPNGNYTQNRRTSGVSFGYGGENDDIGVTGYEFSQLKLSAKKLSGIIPISNDLLSMASTAGDRMIRDDALNDAGVAMDRHFLRGSGTEFAPKGLRWQLVGTPLEASNILAMTAAPDLQKIDNDLGRAELALGNANVDFTAAHWIMSPRVSMFLTNLRDGNGNRVYPEMQAGKLRQKPVHVTTEIPSNLGAGSDESEIMLVEPRQVIIGEHNGIKIKVTDVGVYKDGQGDLQSAFSRDETLMRMIMQHDIGLRHLAAVAVLTGVTWGG